jgi:hypothetical protein
MAHAVAAVCREHLTNLEKTQTMVSYWWDTRPIDFKADKSHQVRNYTKFLFSLSLKTKKDKMRCASIDAERIKRCVSWTLCLHSRGTFEEFQTAVPEVLGHQFNNHKLCSRWWTKKEPGSEEEEKDRLRFWCKERNSDLYAHFKQHHDEFMKEDSLRKLHHPHDTNHMEAFNKLIIKFLPKDRSFCQTIENKVTTYLATCI